MFHFVTWSGHEHTEMSFQALFSKMSNIQSFYTLSLLTGSDGGHLLCTEEFPASAGAETHRVIVPGTETGEKASVHLTVENEGGNTETSSWMQFWKGSDGWKDHTEVVLTKDSLLNLPVSSALMWAVKHVRRAAWLADDVWGRGQRGVCSSSRADAFMCLNGFEKLKNQVKDAVPKRMILPVHLCLGTVIPKHQHCCIQSFGWLFFHVCCLFDLLIA